MSQFDSLLDFGDDPSDTMTTTSNDPLGSGQNGGSHVGALLDLGFEAEISSQQNGDSGQVSFEANTNPLYELKNNPAETKMASEPSNPLYELSNESQLPEKSTNPLYDFQENENQNGHSQDYIVNGGSNGEADLLVTTETVASEDSGVTMDTNATNDVGEITQEDKEEEEEAFEEQEIEDQSQPEPLAEEAGKDMVEEPSHQDNGCHDDTEQDNVDTVVEEKVEDTEEDAVEKSEPIAESEATIESQPVVENEPSIEPKSEPSVETEPMAVEESQPAEQPEDEAEIESQPEPEVVEAVVEPEEETAPEPEEGDEQSQEVEPAVELQEPELEPEPVAEQISEPEQPPEQAVEDAEPETKVSAPEEIKEEEIPEEEEPAPAVVEEVDTVEESPVPQDQADDAPTETEPVEVQEVVEEPQMTEEPVTEAPVAEEPPVALVTGDEEPAIPEVEASQEPEQAEESETSLETEQKIEEKKEDPVKEERPESPRVAENGTAKVNGTNGLAENGVDEEVERDPNVIRETREKEEVPQFEQMSNFRQKFESGGPSEEDTPKKFSIKDEVAEGGEYESTPVVNPDVVRESDRSNIGEELPEVGMAKNILSRFQQIQEESQKPQTGRQASPPKQTGPVEYVSEPAASLEQYQGQSDAGVFESTPQRVEGVIRADDALEDVPLPEKGYTQNIAQKYKAIEAEAAKTKVHQKKELTPDRSGRVEFVSEPRGMVETYEGKPDSGVFESQPVDEEDVVKSGELVEEVLPEVGMAKSLLSKFKQMESEVHNKPPPSPKRELTPDRFNKAEYVSEPRGYLEKYEPKTESGVFESKPEERPEVVRAGEEIEDVLPEAGAAKKTLEKFKEMQKQSTSPVSKTKKEFTPPRETSPGKTVAGVLENEPIERQEGVVKATDIYEAELPERGMAKNILTKFKQLESEGSQSPPSRGKKEFTPPPEAGVFESTPEKPLIIEAQKAESGLLESQPAPRRDDIAREDQIAPDEEFPEKGYARNLVSKFRQIESDSTKNSSSTSPRFKEFTPPRDTRGLLSPKSPADASNSVSPSDLPAQYQEQKAAGVFENEPEYHPDIAREADTDYLEGMPKANTTMSMLSKFREIQQKAKDDQETPKPISRKDSPVKKKKEDPPSPEPEPEEKGMFIAVETEKCAACQKTVYAMEKLEMNKTVYHRACFKCSHCSARLTAKTFSMNEGVIYCTNHFKQLFARKGNYDEGFGRQQYKKKWTGDAKKDEQSS